MELLKIHLPRKERHNIGKDRVVKNVKNHDTLCAVIMAGGKGTRIQSLNLPDPKPLVNICGFPFLQMLAWWVSPYVSELVILTTEKIKAQTASLYFPANCRIEISDGNGTGTDFLQFAQNNIFDSYLVMNADTIIDMDIKKVTAQNGSFIVTTAWKDAQNAEKIVVNRSGRVLASLETEPPMVYDTDETAGLYASTGIVKLESKLINSLRPDRLNSIEKDILPVLIQNRDLCTYHLGQSLSLDFGTPERFARLPEFEGKIKDIYGDILGFLEENINRHHCNQA